MICNGRTVLSKTSIEHFEIVDAVYEANSLDPFHVHRFAHLSIVLWGSALEVRDSQPLCYSRLAATGQENNRGHSLYFPVQTRIVSVTTLHPIPNLPAEPVLLELASFPLKTAAQIRGLLQLISSSDRPGVKHPAWLQKVAGTFPWQSRIPLRVAAEMAGVSQAHFDRVFRHATGQSPRERRRWAKIAVASRLLLQTNTPIAGVALDAGFSSQSHLTAAFKSGLGITPRVYRRFFAQTS